MSTKAKWIAAAATGALITTGVAVVAAPAKDSHGTIVKVIDGDTVDMRIAGDVTRVRLLNIDTPETVDPRKAVECLGPEASDYLKSLLLPGDKVGLEYDVERTDRYGRTLAAVFKDGDFVNADIAAAGLGIAVKYEPNVKYYEQVKQAEQAAASKGLGLNDVSVGCTLPAQIAQAEQALEQVPETLGETIEESGSLATETAAAIAVGAGVKSALAKLTPDSHPVTHALLTNRYASAMSRLDSGLATARSTHKAHEDQRAKLVRAERERREAEAERKRKEEEARRKAEQARQQEEQRQAALAEQRRVQQQQKAKSVRTAPKKSARVKSTPRSIPKKAPSNYTGPRCYAPGGKTWRPC